MLTGRRPFRGSLEEVCRQIFDAEQFDLTRLGAQHELAPAHERSAFDLALAEHRQPKHRGKAHRKQLEPGIPERMIDHRV